jgi:hypothetical protein
MAPSDRRWLVAVPLACAACTFTGLGNYNVATCATPVGVTGTVQQVGSLDSSNLTFATANGASPIGAFPSIAVGGTCAQAVGTSGYVESSSCAFFVGEAPEQPWVIPLGGGYGAAAITTAEPCSAGQLEFQFVGQSVGGSATASCTTGAALPAMAAAPDGTSAVVAWYETPYTSRNNPIQSCAGATAAPLVVATIANAASGNPGVGTPRTLSSAGISIRPPAVVAQGQGVVVAAPDGNDVSVWSLDASLTTTAQTSVPSLAAARAVAMAAAGDGSGALAVVAEINCTPQSIAVSFGTVAYGFSTATVVASPGSKPTVQPTVAWVSSENDWIVSWIAADGGAHALAQRFDPNGNPVGATIDPSTPASGASVAADGSLLAYVPGSNSFVTASLGCAE